MSYTTILNLLSCVSPILDSFLSYMWHLLFWWILLKNHLKIYGILSLCFLLLSHEPYPPLFLWTLGPFSQLKEAISICWDFFSILQSSNFLKSVKWGIHKLQHVCFPSFMDHCPLFFLAQYIEYNVYFIYFAHLFFYCFIWESNYLSYSSILAQNRSSMMYFIHTVTPVCHTTLKLIAIGKIYILIMYPGVNT